jgi:tetratricopeptide (TPR) repeat protein
MFFEQNKYFDAERYFLKAKEGQIDRGLVELRLAQINFYLKEYQEAENNLQLIPDEPRYLFDKLILKGNLFFSQKDYSKALQAYDNALQYSPSNETEKKVLNRKAWTLYQMRDYSRAAEIYRTLSLGETGDPAYLLKAASSAFSAQNYKSAIELYEEFITKYPDSDLLLDARIGLANAYYNEGDFVQAALYYRELVNPVIDPEIMQNSLNGLRWSCEQDDSIDYLGIVNDILQQYDEKDFKARLLQDKIRYLYNRKMWKEVLQSYNQLDQSTIDAIRNDYFQIYQAIAMTKLGYFDQAEQVFNLIAPEQRDPEVYSAWADLKLVQNDEIGAIEKLRSASQPSRDYNIWLLLLRLEQQNDHDKFLNDYNKFREFAGLQETQQAKLIWLRWKISHQEFTGLEDQINELAASKYTNIKAGSQLFKGLLLYYQEEYDSAIPELLRVRYLYPEMGDVRIEAEYYACLAYIGADRKEEAEQLYELIGAELTPEMKAEIEKGLRGDE